MPGGRPSKFTSKTVEQTLYYIENYEKFGDKIPSVAGLACHLKVARETVHEWARGSKKEQFSHILTRLLAKQEQVLLSSGLDGTFNAAITKLVLSKHSYSDRQDITTNGQSIKNDWVIMPTSSKDDDGEG